METTHVATQTKLTPVRIGILLLGLATAIIHLQLAFPDVMFILNGLGYLGLLAAYFLPIPIFQERHNLVRWALIAFAAVTIIGWVLIGERSTLGYVDKTIEVLLIILLLVDSR
jgi:hypothetical protein